MGAPVERVAMSGQGKVEPVGVAVDVKVEAGVLVGVALKNKGVEGGSKSVEGGKVVVEVEAGVLVGVPPAPKNVVCAVQGKVIAKTQKGTSRSRRRSRVLIHDQTGTNIFARNCGVTIHFPLS
jgi:hypothetical protein